jgi:hypothetical protein
VLNGNAPTVLETLPPSPTPDYSAIRLRVGPLTREESASLDPALTARWSAFMSGEDAAYRPLDLRVIEALRTGQTDGGLPVYLIGGALLAGVDQWSAQRLDAVGYMVFDHQTGEPTVIGWLDEFTGDVIEASTGYRLNVRDHLASGLRPAQAASSFTITDSRTIAHGGVFCRTLPSRSPTRSTAQGRGMCGTIWAITSRRQMSTTRAI